MQIKPRNYKIHQRITRREMESQLYMDRRLYLRTAKLRFSLLDEDYIGRKITEERFPLDGNVELAKAITSALTESPIRGKIRILDIGASGGALTTLCLLKELFDIGKVDVDVTLLDISLAALMATLEWRFFLPIDILKKEYGWTDDFVSWARKVISRSKVVESDIIELNGFLRDGTIGEVDICISGFTHHHMNIFDKAIAVRRMEQAIGSGGLIGIVDESLSYKDYVDWIKKHLDERNSKGELVPIALESFISMEEHISFLEKSELLTQERKRHYYYFVVRKNESE